MVTPAVKREALAHLRTEHEMSERQPCRVIGCQQLTVRYRSRHPDDPALRERLRALARERRRFGYRRLPIFLRREGFIVNHKRLFRIYREERLMVRKRGGRKRALGIRAPMAVPQFPNDRRSLDFVADQLASGRRFRILAIFDDCTRECLAAVVDISLSDRRVARELVPLIAKRGQPQDDRQRQWDRTDQQRDPRLGRANPGGMALHRAREAHAERLRRELQWAFARPVPERDSVHVASQARLTLEDWRRDYNNTRPHSRIGWLAPAVYAAQFSPQRDQGAALDSGWLRRLGPLLRSCMMPTARL